MTEPQSKPRRMGLRRILLFVGLPLLAAGMFIVPRAFAGGPFHGRHGHHARSAEDVQEHMERKAEFVLDRLDASDAQRKQVDAIIAKTAPQMFALKQEAQALRKEIKESLAAPTIDKARIDKARVELDALANRATELGMDTLVAVAEVLTPEQRKKVAEHLSRFEH